MTAAPATPQAVFAARRWEDLTDAELGAAAAVPSMLATRERRLYVWLTSRWARGAGAVVDLGCFVGGSTACLAQGLALAGHASRVDAYDRFRANDSPHGKTGSRFTAAISWGWRGRAGRSRFW